MSTASSRYRITELAMWADDKFRSLSSPQPNAQTIWQFLLTGPFTIAIPGLVICKPMMIASYYDWDEDPAFREAFAKAFAEVSSKGLVRVDKKAGLMWLPGAAKPHRSAKPASPNVVIGWTKYMAEVPECPLKYEALRELKAFVEGLGEAYGVAFGKAFPDRYPQPSPNQEQEQEQEQEQTSTLSQANAQDAEPPPGKQNTPTPPPKATEPKTKKRKPTPKPPPSETAVKAATYLRDRVLVRAANCAASRMKSDGLDNWARELDKLQTLSPDHSWKAIRASIDWLHDAENTFVVQSAASLAKKWDSIQANRKKSPITGATKPEDPYDRAERLRGQK